jgi:hypothetical protein
MMRQFLMGIAAAAAISLSALPATAQGWGSGPAPELHEDAGPAFRHDGSAERVRPEAMPVRDGWGGGWGGGGWDRGHGRGWGGGGWDRGPRWGGHGYGRAQNCFVRKVRYWDGWGWTVERRRVCH